MRTSSVLAVMASVVAVACGGSMDRAPKSAAAPAAEPSGGAAYAPSESESASYAQPGYPAATPSPAAPPPAAGAPSPVVSASSAKEEARAADAPIAVSPRSEPRRLPQPGQLTAGIWDDNRNYEFWKPYALGFRRDNGGDFSMFTEQEMETARDAANAAQSPRGELDVQLVLDTTGSMGDELSYLQSEFDSIAARIKTRFPQMTPRWSLVLYRDKGDEYVTRQFDFTTDTNKFRADLRAQSASGGGDTPEAVVQGLDAGAKMSWRAQQSNVAKVAFWVADAPAHPGEGKQLASVVKNLKAKGVHVYPVASSDTDDAAEYQMRSAAQLTGGRYVFLTNDSGIGNAHAEPHIPCYAVTRLDSAILRSIETEMTGRRVEPSNEDVLRTVGKPDAQGKCKLSSGALVASF
ncbi:MAG: VWA domain-containing protein [Labilithrix sp.]|nr:VWA domain-containing protein [Labilithrix sp.]MCW5815322.1 VWA domain-containing protein [Labilithrix sp.]